jgi:hypothetical protein
MGGGVPVAALDADLWELNEMLAHLSISLTERPEWAKELEDLFDEELIVEIYKEVISHEDRFHRRGADPEDSGSAAADG